MGTTAGAGQGGASANHWRSFNRGTDDQRYQRWAPALQVLFSPELVRAAATADQPITLQPNNDGGHLLHACFRVRQRYDGNGVRRGKRLSLQVRGGGAARSSTVLPSHTASTQSLLVLVISHGP